MMAVMMAGALWLGAPHPLDGTLMQPLNEHATDSTVSAESHHSNSRPNIMLILSDDQGYTDLGLHDIDHRVKTPNLDRLANQGMLFTNGYAVAPQCVPSRCGILTGRHPNSLGIMILQSDAGYGVGTLPPPNKVKTIAEHLVKNRYHTGMAGKWGIMDQPLDARFKKGQPLFPQEGPHGNSVGLRGFQEYFRGDVDTWLTNIDSAFDVLNGIGAKLEKNQTLPGSGSFDFNTKEPQINRVDVTGAIVEDFIHRFATAPPAGTDNFLMYWAPYAPHVPLVKNGDHYLEKYGSFETYPNFNHEENDARRRGLAMLRAIDDNVGRVMGALKKNNMDTNTLVLYTSDNGAPSAWEFDGKTYRHKVTAPSADGQGWNGSENIPLRGEKASVWEGGVKVPMIAHWPGSISAGQVNHEITWSLDFSATIMDLAGVHGEGHYSNPLHDDTTGTGQSLVDIFKHGPNKHIVAAASSDLTGAPAEIVHGKALTFCFSDACTIRTQNWKLYFGGEGKTYLFNLGDDPNELTDLSTVMPIHAKHLASRLQRWLGSTPLGELKDLGPPGVDPKRGIFKNAQAGMNIRPAEHACRKAAKDERFIVDHHADCYPALMSVIINTTGTDADIVQLDSDSLSAWMDGTTATDADILQLDSDSLD